jgi:hypothetical protein
METLGDLDHAVKFLSALCGDALSELSGSAFQRPGPDAES